NAARDRLLADFLLLRPRPPWPSMRPLRLLPPPPQGLRRSGPQGSPRVPGHAGVTYKVKEILCTHQGEGAHAGRPAVFCRFSSCNLWTVPAVDRVRAICKVCNSVFVGTDGEGGGKFADAESRAEAVASKWPANGGGRPMVVCTGCEPLLQLDT